MIEVFIWGKNYWLVFWYLFNYFDRVGIGVNNIIYCFNSSSIINIRNYYGIRMSSFKFVKFFWWIIIGEGVICI